MSYNFFVVGGDMRIFLLAKKLSRDGNKVRIYGFEKIKDEAIEQGELEVVYNFNDKTIRNEEIVISSIPLTMDGKNIYAPYSNEVIPMEKIKNVEIIAGKIPKGYKGNDAMEDEAITILNTIPTAEGAIGKAIEETNFLITNSNILVLGFGRVGKTLCYKLKNMGANVYCVARNEKDLAWIEAYEYNPIEFSELDKDICKMDIIFNTIPKLVLDKKRLILLSKETLIIDLASKPGGVDFDSAKKLGINAILYGGIPGKIAPDYAADILKKYVYKIAKIGHK